jgi:LysM repeat protein
MALDKRWTSTIDTGKFEPNARVYDSTLQQHVGDYNRRLGAISGYVTVDWKLMRAVVWVESGGPKTLAWTGRVMHIGSSGDPRLSAVKSGEGATSVIVPQTTRDRLASADARTINEPFFNIEVGIAYLWLRMCKSEVGTIIDDPTVYSHTLASGETASSVAQKNGTTVEDIRATNPGLNIDRLSPGDVLRFHKARTGRKITGWYAFTPDNIASRCNVGDLDYAEKLRYVMEALKSW